MPNFADSLLEDPLPVLPLELVLVLEIPALKNKTEFRNKRR
jgi:hypothetical protein